LFAGTNDTITAYSLPDLRRVADLDVEGMVWGLAFDHGRNRLYGLTASFEEPLNTAVWVWDKQSNGSGFQLRHRLRVFGGLGTSLACDPTGKWLAAGEGCGSPQAPEASRVLVWDAATLRLKRVFTCHNGWVEAVAFSPDGRWLLSGDGSGPIGKPNPSAFFLHDIEANRTALAVGAHAGWVRSLAFDRGGDLLFSGGSDGVWVWDFARLMAGQGTRFKKSGDRG
jgi:WD40 repeat protein